MEQKMNGAHEKLICVICGTDIEIDAGDWKYGHNAFPVRGGRCCESCNMTVVIPARLRMNPRLEELPF